MKVRGNKEQNSRVSLALLLHNTVPEAKKKYCYFNKKVAFLFSARLKGSLSVINSPVVPIFSVGRDFSKFVKENPQQEGFSNLFA